MKKNLAFLIASSGNQAYMAGNVCIGINENVTIEEYDIIILYSNTSENDIAAYKKIPNVHPVPFAFEEKFAKSILENAYIGSKIRGNESIMAFSHYEVFKILANYKKVIWLDTDVLINGSLDKIIQEEAVLSATADIGWTVGSNFSKDVPGYDMQNQGICSAVLVLNDALPYESLYQWCYKKTLELENYLFNRDQGIINLAIQEYKIKVNILDEKKWQCMPWHENAVKARIIHFGGGNKVYENQELLKKFPQWIQNHKQWLKYGGSDFIRKKTSVELYNELFELSYKKEYLDLESKRVDKVVRISQEKNVNETNNLKKKISLQPAIKQSRNNNWIIPKNRSITALSNLLKDENEENSKVIESVASQSHLNHVAIVFGGGLGDALKPMAIIPDLVKKLKCHVTIVSDQKAVFEIRKINPYIKNVIYDRRNPYEYAERNLIWSNLYDIVIICKYTINYHVSPDCKIDKEKLDNILYNSSAEKRNYERYNFNNLGWPGMNNALSREIKKNKESVSTITAKTSGLEINSNNYYNIPLYLKNYEIPKLKPLLDSSYITVHYGFDTKKLPENVSPQKYNCTKNISIEKWEKIISEVSKLGLKIIQLGNKEERKIDNIDLYLNGKTTLEQTAHILKNALCHIDTEGGLVHLARSVHTRSVVMFGPTPVTMFGYPQNINLEPTGCKECFWTTQSWILECPRNTVWPDCMEEHKPDTIFKAVSTILYEQRVIEGEIINYFSDIQDLVKVIRNNDLSHTDNPLKTLFVCDEHDIDAAREAVADIKINILYNVVSDSDVASDVVFSESDNIEYGSFINLRYSNDTFDLVVCVSRLWNEPYSHHILDEMMRVLRNNGKLVIGLSRSKKGTDNLGDIFRSNKVSIQQKQRLSDDTKVLVILKKPYEKSNKTIVPVQERYIEMNLLEKNEELKSPLLMELDEIHQSVNSRLDFALSNHQEFIDAEQKNWDISDIIIENSFISEEWISVDKNCSEQYGRKFLLSNWYEPEDWGCWGMGKIQSLILPLERANQDNGIYFEAVVQIRFPISTSTQLLRFFINEEEVYQVKIRKSRLRAAQTISFLIPNSFYNGRKYVIINMEIEECYIPAINEQKNEDQRSLGIGLRRFRYKPID